MSSEVQIRKAGAEPVAHNTVSVMLKGHTHLKNTEYLLAMLALGLETNPQRARLMHMDAKTVASALEGNAISGEFVANLLIALRPHEAALGRFRLGVSFDTFFEIRKEASDV